MDFFKKNKSLLLLFFLVTAGTFLRFYNLNWGSPFYFHPDERNIASSVSQLNFPKQLNPHFFAYGSFPIYLIYLLGIFSNIIHHHDLAFVSFENAVISSRIISAVLSVFLIPLLYILGQELKDKTVGILASFFAATSVGFIQFAHFGTFEVWLTTLGILLFYTCLRIVNNLTFGKIIIASILLGLLLSTKLSSLALIPLPLLSIFFAKKNINFHRRLIYVLPIIPIAVFISIATSPFYIFDYFSFQSSIRYESSVALGTLPVFYTGSFFNTAPVLFQFKKVYPFLLNPFITFIFIPSFLYLLLFSLRQKVISYRLLIFSFSLLFFSQVFFFAKWTRYMIPTLPFVYLMVAIFLSAILKYKTKFSYFLIFLSVASNIIFIYSFFKTVYINPDTRIEASVFVKEQIPADEKILSEVYDMGITPFNRYFNNIILYNFYDLDNGFNTLDLENNSYNYIIVPSQRIFESRYLHGKEFPNGYNFYKSLMLQKEYKKIYETPCDILCKIIYLGSPIFSFEQTANVFDRPTIMIFKKII